LLNGRGSKVAGLPRSVVGGLAPQPQSGGEVPHDPDVSAIVAPNPQMTDRAQRRRFSAEYKLRIIKEADECVARGDLGSLLRREGLFSSTLTNFRRQLAQGQLKSGSGPKARPPKDPAVLSTVAQRLELEKENRQLRRKLAHAERIIALQKKAAILLGETLQDMSLDETD